MRSRTRTQPRPTSTPRCTPGKCAAFRLLSRASNIAREIRRSPWSLAVELEAFVAEQVSTGDLHWLVSRGYAEHRIETTRRGSPTRTFRTAGPAFTVRSCLILTERGMEAARQYGTVEGQHAHRIPPQPEGRVKRLKPRWDAELRQLWLGKVLVKWFAVPAANQEMILSAFQEQGWPARIDDPLPRKAGMDPKERLHAAIRRLNGSQLRRLLRFRGDGTGTGVRWELIAGA